MAITQNHVHLEFWYKKEKSSLEYVILVAT